MPSLTLLSPFYLLPGLPINQVQLEAIGVGKYLHQCEINLPRHRVKQRWTLFREYSSQIAVSLNIGRFSVIFLYLLVGI